MHPAAEGEVAAAAQDVEGAGVGVAARVVVGGAVQDVDHAVLLDGDAGQDGVLGGDPGVDVDRRVVAQHLVHGRVDVLGPGAQPLPATGLGRQQGDHRRQQRRGGLQRGDGDEHGEPVEDLVRLLAVRLQRVPGVDPAGQHVVAGLGAAAGDQVGEVGAQLHGRLGGDRQIAAGGQQLLRVHLVVGDLQDVRVVLGRQPQPGADGVDRQLFADRGDEVGLTPAELVGQLVQEPVGVALDVGGEAFDGGAVEEVAQRAALASVFGSVEPGQGARHLPGGEGVPPLGVVLPLLPGEVGACQLRPRSTWLQASNPVTKYPFHGARTTSPIVRSSASIPYGSACPSGELSLRSRPMTARRPSGVLDVPPVMLTQSSLD